MSEPDKLQKLISRITADREFLLFKKIATSLALSSKEKEEKDEGEIYSKEKTNFAFSILLIDLLPG